MWSPQIQKGVCRLPTYLGTLYGDFLISNTRLSLSLVAFSKAFFYQKITNIEVLQHPEINSGFRLIPVRSSLTKGISYDFFSSRYLDISVPGVSFSPDKSGKTPLHFAKGGCPIRTPPDQSFLDSSPTTIVVLYVLLRPSKPRHPLFALIHICNVFYKSTLIIKLEMYWKINYAQNCAYTLHLLTYCLLWTKSFGDF